MRNLKLCAVLVITLVCAGARADVLWDQGFTGTTAGGAGGAILGIEGLEENSNKCDDFTLTQSAEITTVTFWCYNYVDNLGDTGPIRVSIEFFSNNSGQPANSGVTNSCRPVGWNSSDPNATLPWYAEKDVTSYQGGEGDGWLYKAVVTTETGGGLTVTDSGYTCNDNIVWEVTATLPTAFMASAGTTYWVGMDMSNQTVSGAGSDLFCVLVKGGTDGTNNAYESGVGTLWGGGYDFQFVMEGTVPEPATMSLLGLGGLGLLIRRRRSQ